MQKNANILKKEEAFHDVWAKKIDTNDLCVLEAFEGPVSPEYHFAVNLLGNVKDRKILNPGCGAGEESVYLATKNAQVTAFDISAEMLKVAQKLTSKFKVEKLVQFKKMNAEKLEFEDESFDLIFGNSVLHHIDIKKAIKEFHHVLKKNGKAVFIEPLAYNPLINRYRKMAKNVRTQDEHPLRYEDIEEFKKYFTNVRHYEFQLTTLLIFCYFFLVERVSPNKDRYWKKIIREGEKYSFVFKILNSVDKVILTVFPFMKRLCWVTVVEAVK